LPCGPTNAGSDPLMTRSFRRRYHDYDPNNKDSKLFVKRAVRDAIVAPLGPNILDSTTNLPPHPQRPLNSHEIRA